MNRTDELIDRLVAHDGRTGRLPPPWRRAIGWLALSLPYVALIVLAVGPRADLVQKMSDARFLIEETAMFVTVLFAALAAFCAVVPGSPRRLLLLPVLPLGVWLSSLGQGCVETWLRLGPEGLSLRPDWICLPAIMLVGAIPAIAMALMLRKGAPLFPHAAVALGGLAAAALGNFGLRLFHTTDASLMVLVWQFGSVALLALIAGCLGPYVHNWRKILPFSQRGSIG
ncbi:MAG: NrsF family protein [Gammaproteobacteria bacterium]